MREGLSFFLSFPHLIREGKNREQEEEKNEEGEERRKRGREKESMKGRVLGRERERENSWGFQLGQKGMGYGR